jgi:hypothetical protein
VGRFIIILTLLAACGPNLYELPDPPPREFWVRHSLTPGEDSQRSRERFLAAQITVVLLVEALQENRYEDAYRLLSNETRILLDVLSPSGRGETVLEDGVIERNGAEYHVDPLDLFVIRDMAEITDSVTGEIESETYRRKEVFAISTEGDTHHLVLILEEDEWRIHKPEIDLTPGAPGRRSPTI